MDIFRTLNYLKTARVAVIASEDNKILKEFINCISECNCSELSIADSIQYDGADNSNELKIATVNKIITLKELTVYHIIPIEFLNKKRFVTALLRSLFFCIPENDKLDIQLFNLHYFGSDLRLECEFGEHAGLYVVYEYDAVTGQFTEKE